MIIYPASRQHQ